MTFKLPELPYAYDALQPHMSAETLQFHHDKHHQAYVDNGNKLIAGSGLEGKSIEEICTAAFAGKNAGLVNNIGQHYNHLHFWNWMKPNGGGKKMPGRLERLAEEYGGFDKMRADFVNAGMTQFGSGWCWLAIRDGKLEVAKTSQRREPADARRPANSGVRRVGAQLLHRLSQRASEVPRSLVRQPRELGLRRSDDGLTP